MPKECSALSWPYACVLSHCTHWVHQRTALRDDDYTTHTQLAVLEKRTVINSRRLGDSPETVTSPLASGVTPFLAVNSPTRKKPKNATKNAAVNNLQS